MFKVRWVQTFLLFTLFFSLLKGEELLIQDSFYEEKLPALLGKKFQPKGNYRVAYFARSHHLHPFSNDPFVTSLWDLCSGSLSRLHLGKYQTMAPGLASKIEKKETLSGVDYFIELKEDLFWTPLSPDLFGLEGLDSSFRVKRRVNSADFKFYVDLIQNPYFELPLAVSLREHYQNLESIEIVDDLHFIVHWRGKTFRQDELIGQLRPIPKHVYLYHQDGTPLFKDLNSQESQSIVARFVTHHWAQRAIVSCGPWEMGRVSLETLELVRNPNYLEPYGALFEKISFIHKASLNSAWQAFKMNELDSVYLMPSQWENYQAFINSKLYQKQKEKGLEIEQIQFLTRIYYFIGWNQKNRLFQDKKVRKALSCAIHRNQIIAHFLKGFGSPITGPFIPSSSSNDPSLEPLPYNPKLACELLNEHGWKILEHKGIRTDGRGDGFHFKLMYYLKNELSQSICQYISNTLREIGVDCQLEGVDYAEFLERYQKKDFDAIYMAWSLGIPPEDLSPTWSSTEADVEGSTNLVGFKNEEIDLLLKKLKVCENLALREKYYREIHKLIYEEQPYTFLYAPHQIFLYRSTLGNVFIPKLRPDLINQPDVEEPCLRIFYFKEFL